MTDGTTDNMSMAGSVRNEVLHVMHDATNGVSTARNGCPTTSDTEATTIGFGGLPGVSCFGTIYLFLSIESSWRCVL
jgi:hypothetical protein